SPAPPASCRWRPTGACIGFRPGPPSAAAWSRRWPTAATEVRARGAGIEAAARAHLCRAGLRPIAANATARVGELDLVMRDGDTLLFVEVRFRSSPPLGDGESSNYARKRRRLVLATRQCLARRRDLQDAPCRFDVVVASDVPDAPTLRWLRDAFRADD